MSIRSCGSSSAWALMTVSELTAGMKVTCRPFFANSPSCRATKKPAESAAGTTATFRFAGWTDGAAALPPVTLGRNRIARTTPAATAHTTSEIRTARVNLRANVGLLLDVPRAESARTQLRGPAATGPVPWSAGRSAGAAGSGGGATVFTGFPGGGARADPQSACHSARRSQGTIRATCSGAGAGCKKNGAASCSERHRSADGYSTSAMTGAPLARAEEVEHPLDQQRGRAGVVRRQRAVGKVVLVAGVEEQFGVLGLLDDLAGGVDVALAHEDRIGVHPVYLHRHPVGPGRAERRDRDARIEQQRAPRARPRLRQLLGREHAEREAGVDQPAGQFFDGLFAAPDHLVGEADLLGIAHPFLKGAEGTALEQVGRVHRVPGATQLVGDRDDAGGQSLRVVEEHHLGHVCAPVMCRKRASPRLTRLRGCAGPCGTGRPAR